MLSRTFPPNYSLTLRVRTPQPGAPDLPLRRTHRRGYVEAQPCLKHGVAASRSRKRFCFRKQKEGRSIHHAQTCFWACAMQIMNDGCDLFIAKATLKRRHDARASLQHSGTNSGVRCGRAAWKAWPLKNSCEIWRDFTDARTFSVVAAAAIQFK